jgi:E3 ubiquitin-protein ligase HECTD4
LSTLTLVIIFQNGKAEVTTEEAVSALRRAAKWAQMGLVVSTGPPIDTSTTSDTAANDKKKTAVEVVCKEKNAELAR